jgi:23S rRNA (uracil1939-C5)-methyltransferase
MELTITKLGGMGDGIGTADGKQVFVPYTCPGDKVKVALEAGGRARLLEVMERGISRQEPPCQHFGQCGGCSLQHIRPSDYNAFKRDILVQVARKLGYGDEMVSPLVEVGQGSRRRAEFKVSVNKGEVGIGFFEAKSHKVIDIAICPVTSDAIVGLLPKLRAVISSLKKPGNVKAVNVSQMQNGLDVFITVGANCSANDAEKLVAFAKGSGILRLAQKEEKQEADVLYCSKLPLVAFGGVEVELPVGSFLQATQTGQLAITSIILETLKEHKRVVDLYCGAGTYSLPLVMDGHIVQAYEGSNEMITALHNAIRQSNLDSKIAVGTRDLFKRPVKQHELKNFDAVVINPPRNGALPQADEIAKSDVKKVVMVSCNPATFERDTKSLINGGFVLERAAAIDQFYWNAHLEVVGVFCRK